MESQRLSPLLVRPNDEARRWTRLPPITNHHQERSRRAILDTARLARSGLAAVYGAGKCDEIPLRELTDRFERVLLFDEDAATLEEGVSASSLDVARQSKVALQVADLTGACQPLVASVRRVLNGLRSPGDDTAAARVEALIDAVVEIVDQAQTQFAASDQPPDLVVASCVLSQLHISSVRQVLAEVDRHATGLGLPELAAAVRQSRRWTESLLALSWRMEQGLVDALARDLAAGGVAYVSDTVQMCFVRLLADGAWASDGLFRMTRTTRLADYFDSRFAVEPLGEWGWVVDAPRRPDEVGRAYRVQALRLRSAVNPA